MLGFENKNFKNVRISLRDLYLRFYDFKYLWPIFANGSMIGNQYSDVYT